MMYTEEQIENAYELGFKYHAARAFCPQCAIAALMDTIGDIDEAVFIASQGLSGGTASCGCGTCGALAGGILVIGSRFGRDRVSFERGEKHRKISLVSKELCDKFFEVYGGLTCAQVQTAIMGRSFNLWDPAEKQLFDEMGGHSEKCPSVVGNAAKWTIEILNKYEN
ncbi:MAG: C-GCAxxG-C-C family protein [Flexilinea sp.]